jgi:hypothetical protein
MAEVKSGGIDFVGGLQLLFIALKLTGFIAWSWWVVLLPMLVFLGLCAIGLVLYAIGEVIG